MLYFRNRRRENRVSARAVTRFGMGTSYTTGELFSLPTNGGPRRVIARKLNKPTALAIDDTAAYVYTEGDRRVSRIELASGASSLLGKNLENSDELVVVGDYIYTVSWPRQLVRLSTIAGREP